MGSLLLLLLLLVVLVLVMVVNALTVHVAIVGPLAHATRASAGRPGICGAAPQRLLDLFASTSSKR